MKTLVSPDQLPEFGFYRYSNRHLKRLEEAGVIPRRVPVSYHKFAYVKEELIDKANAAVAKRDAKAAG